MKLPRWVQVGPRRVEILREKLPDDDRGEFKYATKAAQDGGYQIRVDPDLDPAETALTFLHELVHAVSDLGGANLKEHQVLCLEHGLGKAIQDHPELFRQLVNVLSKKPR